MGVQWGVGGLENKGNVAAEDRGLAKLKRSGVVTDKLPVDVYSVLHSHRPGKACWRSSQNKIGNPDRGLDAGDLARLSLS